MPETLVAVKSRVSTTAALVIIRIIEKGGRYKLKFSPKRPPTIYYKVPRQQHNDDRKSQVAWVASGLEEGQSLYITAKPNSHFGYMRHECYGPIDDSRRVVYSGSLLRGPEGRARKVRWKYNVILTNAAGRKLASYDPDVIIDKDPHPQT